MELFIPKMADLEDVGVFFLCRSCPKMEASEASLDLQGYYTHGPSTSLLQGTPLKKFKKRKTKKNIYIYITIYTPPAPLQGLPSKYICINIMYTYYELILYNHYIFRLRDFFRQTVCCYQALPRKRTNSS